MRKKFPQEELTDAHGSEEDAEHTSVLDRAGVHLLVNPLGVFKPQNGVRESIALPDDYGGASVGRKENVHA